MTPGVAAVLREGCVLTLLLAAPLLVAALVAGVVAGLLGALTQLADPAIGLVARVAAVGAAVVLFGPAIARQLVAFAATLWPLVTAVGVG